jgi:uncharacterized protein
MIVVGIVDGARHIAVDRLAGDDVTAILAGVAGVVLVALGAAVLWRTRRLDERPLRRYLRGALVGVIAVFAAVFVVLPVALAIVVNHKARAPVEEVDLGRPYVDVSLTTSDGLRLAGWYVPSRNGAAVIAFPGRKGVVAHARMLVRHGYGVLLLDRRGEGESEGDYNARGWGGEPDLRAAVAYLRGRPDVQGGRIGGLGLSVGGEMLLSPRRMIPGCGPWCPRAPGCARSPSRSTCRTRPGSRCAGSRRSPWRRPPAWCSRTTCRHQISPT